MSDAANNPGTVPDQSHPSIPADATIILPVRNTLLFPGMVLPLTIGRPASIAAAQEAVRSGGKIGLLLQDDPAVEQSEGGGSSPLSLGQLAVPGGALGT
jgi:ATP-dependent Lon protease